MPRTVVAAEPSTFHVLAVGTSGAGKTAYMAALFRQLRLKHPDKIFFLTAPPPQSLQLNSIYNEIADPAGAWPMASSTVQEWLFTVQINAPDTSYNPVRFSYLDYPGGVLTNARAADSDMGRTVAEAVGTSDAVLALIDGQGVLGMVRDDEAGRRYAEGDLPALLEVVQQARGPLHFVITKSDLLDSAGVSLAEVVGALLANESFEMVVTAVAEQRDAPIRLIPVSSVGPGFAVLQPDGTMLKTPGARAAPVDVDVPLMAVLPDLLQQRIVELAVAESGLSTRPRLTPGDSDTTSAVAGLLGRFTKLALVPLRSLLAESSPKVGARLAPMLADQRVGDQAAALISALAMRVQLAYAKHYDDRVNALEDRRRALGSARDAAALLQLQFVTVLEEFEGRHPDTVLAGANSDFVSALDPAAVTGPEPPE